MARKVQTCKRTGLPTNECQCYVLVPDIKAEISEEVKAWAIAQAEEARARRDEDEEAHG